MQLIAYGERSRAIGATDQQRKQTPRKTVMKDTHTLKMPGQMLRRGMWLYVWRVDTPKGEMLYVEEIVWLVPRTVPENCF